MMIWDIYNALKDDDLIKGIVKENIKFYEYPEVKSLTDTHVIIDPLYPPNPDDFADNVWLSNIQLFQIDVWSKSMTDRDIVASKIQFLLWEKLNLEQIPNGIDEYDKDYDIFRDARRYRVKKYVI